MEPTTIVMLLLRKVRGVIPYVQGRKGVVLPALNLAQDSRFANAGGLSKFAFSGACAHTPKKANFKLLLIEKPSLIKTTTKTEMKHMPM